MNKITFFVFIYCFLCFAIQNISAQPEQGCNQKTLTFSCTTQVDSTGNPCYLVIQGAQQIYCTSTDNPMGITQNYCGQFSYCDECTTEKDDIGNPCYWIGDSMNGYLCTNANYYRNVLCSPGSSASNLLMCGGSLLNNTNTCSSTSNPMTIMAFVYLLYFILLVPHFFNLISFYFYVFRYGNIKSKWLIIPASIIPFSCWTSIDGYFEK